MEINVTLFAVLSIIYFLGAHVGLYLIFEKLGIPGWKALIPFQSTHIMVKTIKKSIWWTIFYYLPFAGFVVWMGIIVELLKLFGYYKLKDHFLAVVFAPIYLYTLAKKPDFEFKGYEQREKYKKPKSREWVDAIAFAVIAASLIRMFYFEAFTIPTSSMERTLLRGDFLFVSKLSYGPRIPNTPVSFPFIHHSFPEWFPIVGGKKSYSEIIKFPYYKLPGFGDVERNDYLVFNFPAGDTVVYEHQDQSYYQLARENGRQFLKNNFTIIARPVDKRENYIKRVVGLPGDKLEIIDTELRINDKPAYKPKNYQFLYKVITNGTGFNYRNLIKKGITKETPRQVSEYEYHIFLTDENVLKLKSYPNVKSIEKIIKPKGYDYSNRPGLIFPNSKKYNWTEDNFGPINIPKKGETVKLTLDNLPIYKRIIADYEGNDLKVVNNKIYINDQETDTYTFKMSYYWLMGDNRHNSLDSRFWGFVPEDHVVGKAVFIWFSLSPHPEDGNFFQRIRWDRLFTFLDKE
jgi:signal peptidase I